MNIQDQGQRNRLEIPADTPGNLNVVVSGDDNLLRIGSGCRFPNLRIEIRANGCEIDLGANCVLVGEIHCREPGTRLLVGERSTAMGMKITLHEPGTIRLGRDCMLAGDVRMDTSDMHSILDLASGDRINPAADVEVGDHVWLGYGVYLMKGVKIGAGCVVGAGSIVTQDLPPHSLAVGVPARVVRSGITWDRRRLPLKNPPPQRWG